MVAGVSFDKGDRSALIGYISGVLPVVMTCTKRCGAQARREIHRQSAILRVQFVEHYQGAALVQVTV